MQCGRICHHLLGDAVVGFCATNGPLWIDEGVQTVDEMNNIHIFRPTLENAINGLNDPQAINSLVSHMAKSKAELGSGDGQGVLGDMIKLAQARVAELNAAKAERLNRRKR